MDEPSPTIVGPQSQNPKKRPRLDVPRGIERIVALAGINETLRERVLRDPAGAAEEAGLKLTDTERAILKSVPRQSLEAMVESFRRAAGPMSADLVRATTLAAAAALLATGLAGCDQIFGITRTAGIAPDEPGPKPPPQDTVDRVAPGGALGDEPPTGQRPAAQPEKDRILLTPPATGQIQNFRDPRAGPAAGAPDEEEPTRGIRGDEP